MASPPLLDVWSGLLSITLKIHDHLNTNLSRCLPSHSSPVVGSSTVAKLMLMNECMLLIVCHSPSKRCMLHFPSMSRLPMQSSSMHDHEPTAPPPHPLPQLLNYPPLLSCEEAVSSTRLTSGQRPLSAAAWTMRQIGSIDSKAGQQQLSW